MPRRRRRRVRKLANRPWRAVVVVVALLIVVALRGWPPQGESAPDSPDSLDAGPYQVQRVVDGDTLVLTNGGRVRLIGADTPETVKPDHPVEPWGPEATQFTRDFVAGGRVRLELDGPRKDKYGRFLAHVWVGERQLAEELIRAGLARAETGFSYDPAKKARLRAAEAAARAEKRGLWSDDRPGR